ncbi:hypothetical protein EUTSA_v10009890mg [Eutrema salsugineum]|uniref:RING-type domain-containing protein n=2 Tax=Eutrema salsugineum TaxID=72664 RepID=V4MRY3_EUTSA|nr:hypothetical protein EUTSA_v10009890mg [Eutrema salsugineum]
MNLVALVLLILHLVIFSCVDAGKVVLMDSNITRSFDDIEADFSPPVNSMVETGVLYLAEPFDACQDLRNKPRQSPNDTSPFVLIVRGGCSFEHKIRDAQRSDFKAAIVHDNVDRDILLAMGGDSDGIKIQAVFVTKEAGEKLKSVVGLTEKKVMLVPSLDDSGWLLFANIAMIVSLAIFVALAACVLVYRHCTTHSNVTFQFHGMSRRMVKAMPSVTFTSVHEDNTTGFSCAICLEDYSVGDKLRVLPCGHKYHAACVDSWLTSWRTFCPVCKRDARTRTYESPASESTPLLRSPIVASSVVVIDPPPVGSSHHSSSYIHQSFRSSSRISADIRQQTSPLHLPSLRSYATCMDSLHSIGYSTMSPLNAIGMPPYRPSPSNVSPGLVQSTNHRLSSLSPFASAHSLRDNC